MIIKIIIKDYTTDDGYPFTLQYPAETKDMYMPIIEDLLRKGFVLTLSLEEK